MSTTETRNDTIQINDLNLLEATEPGQLRVIRRDGMVAKYDEGRITVAIKKAFLAVEGDNATNSERVEQIANELTHLITEKFQRRWPDGGTIHIEAIQDQVELALMRKVSKLWPDPMSYTANSKHRNAHRKASRRPILKWLPATRHLKSTKQH